MIGRAELSFCCIFVAKFNEIFGPKSCEKFVEITYTNWCQFLVFIEFDNFKYLQYFLFFIFNRKLTILDKSAYIFLRRNTNKLLQFVP
jgi:hypothetical protein